MEDPTLIDEEVRRRKRNNTRLQKEAEDRQLIADGEGRISPSSEQQDTDLSPLGPRKAKTMALKNASKSWLWRNYEILTKSVLAWYEAQRKKRPRSPSPDNSDKGEHRASDEGASQYILAAAAMIWLLSINFVT